MYVCHNMDEHLIYYDELMKSAIDKTTSKEKFNLGLDDSFPNKPHGSWGISVSVQTINYYIVYSRSPQPLIYGLLGTRPQSKRWAMGEEEKFDGYLEPLLITHIAIWWSPPPVRLAAALDFHRSMKPTVNCSCEVSRLSTPYQNLIPYDLRWSWSNDASTGEHLQVRLSLAERLTAEGL